MIQPPEQCESCKKQIATLEICLLPDGTETLGAGVTFGRAPRTASGASSAPAGAGREGIDVSFWEWALPILALLVAAWIALARLLHGGR